jgi:hypothetical protein
MRYTAAVADQRRLARPDTAARPQDICAALAA